MTAAHDLSADHEIHDMMNGIGHAAKSAALELASATEESKNAALHAAAAAVQQAAEGDWAGVGVGSTRGR